MDWRLLEDWWERLKSSRREAVRREQETAFVRERQDRDADRKRKHDDREAEVRFAVLTLSQESRRQLQQLFTDIDDASKAGQLAYQRAVRDEEAARAALDEARRNAIVLSDGRRAYFDAGGRLFLEDGGEITDAADIDAARRAHDLKPGATSYESYQEKFQNTSEANERLDRTGETLRKLRELKERLDAGTATPDELAAARKELDEITQSMSPDMRVEYDQLRDARTSDVPTDGPASDAPTVLYSEFTRAAQAVAAQESQQAVNPDATSTPAYKNAPEF